MHTHTHTHTHMHTNTHTHAHTHTHTAFVTLAEGVEMTPDIVKGLKTIVRGEIGIFVFLIFFFSHFTL